MVVKFVWVYQKQNLFSACPEIELMVIFNGKTNDKMGCKNGPF